jgi:phytoene dehydrogenase-like protein
LLRQLRFSREEFDLHPQRFSEIRFPSATLRFSNDFSLLESEVARVFPHDAGGFRRLAATVESYDDSSLDAPYRAARPILCEHLRDPLLIEMLMCPIQFYGSAEEHDMDFTQFVTMFKALFLEGFARPVNGVRTIIKALVKKYRRCGGELRMRCGVKRLDVRAGRVAAIEPESGEPLTADTVLSSAGFVETMAMCGNATPTVDFNEIGRMTFVESIALLDRKPREFGNEAAIIFFNDRDTFTYATPQKALDFRSGIVCCPNNYEGHDELPEGIARLTWMANFDRWNDLNEIGYAAQKQAARVKMVEHLSRFLPGVASHIVHTDMFTPRTIRRYTGHLNGAVYGSPRKHRDGRTPVSNLFLCGTDQGYLGIVGAMLSGVTMANVHVLSKED